MINLDKNLPISLSILFGNVDKNLKYEINIKYHLYKYLFYYLYTGYITVIKTSPIKIHPGPLRLSVMSLSKFIIYVLIIIYLLIILLLNYYKL